MRRLLAGLLAVLAAVLVGGTATVLAVAVWALGASFFSGQFLGSLQHTPWEVPVILAGLLFFVSLLVAGAFLGAWAGERTLTGRGFPLPRLVRSPRSFPRRAAVGTAAYAAGVVVGLGWTVASVLLAMDSFLDAPWPLGPLALLLGAAGPSMGLGATRFVERWALRPRGGDGGGAATGGSAAPSGAAAVGDGVPRAPAQAPGPPRPSSFGAGFTSTSAATARSAVRAAPST